MCIDVVKRGNLKLRCLFENIQVLYSDMERENMYLHSMLVFHLIQRQVQQNLP